MTKQAQVGIFTLCALLLLFGIFYVITDFGTRHTGYRVGIHFNSAAGISTGSLVYLSGVTVGTVDAINLLPDNTVDVILAVNRNIDIPSTSRFLIQVPLTGSPSLLIVPPIPPRRPVGVVGPTAAPEPEPVLPHEILPIDQQPQGRDTATVSDLLDQGQGEIRRLDTVLADLEKREPRLLDTLQTTLDTANHSMVQLSGELEQMAANLNGSISKAGENVVDLTGTLDRSVSANSGRINTIMAQLDQTSIALNKATQSLQQLATDKDLKTSVLNTAKNIADTTQTIAGITHDLRTLTGNPQTQAQMHDTVANLDATSQRLSSILGGLGGTSSVPGVDEGATPYPPVPFPSISPMPGTSPAPGSSPVPGVSPLPGGNLPRVRRSEARVKLGNLIKNLVTVQVRVSGLSRQLACCQNPVLSNDRGPQSDINAMLFEGGGTSVLVGANDIGFRSTVNFAALQRITPYVRVGGGILYDQLGILGQYNRRAFGLEARAYDPRYPMVDLYGNFAIAPGTRVFFGERDTFHTERRTVYGLQLQF